MKPTLIALAVLLVLAAASPYLLAITMAWAIVHTMGKNRRAAAERYDRQLWRDAMRRQGRPDSGCYLLESSDRIEGGRP